MSQVVRFPDGRYAAASVVAVPWQAGTARRKRSWKAARRSPVALAGQLCFARSSACAFMLASSSRLRTTHLQTGPTDPNAGPGALRRAQPVTAETGSSSQPLQ